MLPGCSGQVMQALSVGESIDQDLGFGGPLTLRIEEPASDIGRGAPSVRLGSAGNR